jgi:hypothetical protein
MKANHLADLNEISPDQRPVLDGALDQIARGAFSSTLFMTLLDDTNHKYTNLEQDPVQWTSVDFLKFTTVMILIAVLLAYFLPALSEASGSPKKTRKSKR